MPTITAHAGWLVVAVDKQRVERAIVLSEKECGALVIGSSKRHLTIWTEMAIVGSRSNYIYTHTVIQINTNECATIIATETNGSLASARLASKKIMYYKTVSYNNCINERNCN